MSATLGVRNCNYGNIRYSKSIRWKGLIGENKGFCVFESPEYGLRALIINLRTYILKHGLRSVEEIISRYAPRSENNTCVYISNVCNILRGLNLDTDFIVYRDQNFCVLVHAICWIESRVLVSPERVLSIIKQFNL